MGGGGSKDKDDATAAAEPVVPSPTQPKQTFSDNTNATPAPTPAAKPAEPAAAAAPAADADADSDSDGPSVKNTKFHVFLDVAIGADGDTAKIIFELRGDVAPNVCENFRRLCTGEGAEEDEGHSYTDSAWHNIAAEAAHCGVIDGYTAFGSPATPSEQLDCTTGTVSMLSEGGGAYGSAFLVHLMDGDKSDQHIAFGTVVKGFEAFMRMSAAAGAGGAVDVIDGGEISKSAWKFMSGDNDEAEDEDDFSTC